VIVGVDGKPVRDCDDLFRILDDHEVGDTVSITIRRDDREIKLSVTLQALL
jgi:S1-C subfamily serine protease